MLLFLVALLLTACQQSPYSSSSDTSSISVATEIDPETLDPRMNRTLESITALHMLYEGLFRTDPQGKLFAGLAEKTEVSDDLKTYTIRLRPSTWSDGTPLTANDFVTTWQSILAPEFPAPNAYQLFLIKGAEAAKRGDISLDKVGIHAPDSHTLIVELIEPTPYFKELLSTHFFLPVSPQTLQGDRKSTVTNGPFVIQEWKPGNELITQKNPHYWDADSVQIDSVQLIKLDDNTALHLFETGSLDWAGSPLSTIPPEALPSLKQEKRLGVTPGSGTHWFRFNVQAAPFDNKKMRQAFSYALDRKGIVTHVTQGNQIPALGVVPPSFGLKKTAFFEDHDTTKAWTLFQEALQEMDLSKDEIPSITLYYVFTSLNHKVAQAVQEQWEETFGIPVKLQSFEGRVLFDKLRRKDFQISYGSWYADFRDPINFLEVFKTKENGLSNTGWESRDYQVLLNASQKEAEPKKRMEILSQAEALLMEEMPVAPLFFSSYNYLKKKDLHGVYFSELGYLDFKYAFRDSMILSNTDTQ